MLKRKNAIEEEARRILSTSNSTTDETVFAEV